MDPGRRPARPARIGRTCRRATPSSTSTTRRSVRTPSPARAAAPPSCASRARPRRSSPRPTATRPSAPWIRGWARRCRVAEATRNVSITGARPLGVTNCLNYGDPTRPEAFWQLPRASAAWPTRAWRSGCRSRAATCRSTTSRRPARSPRRPRSASSGCSRTSRRSSARRSRAAHDAILLVGEARPVWPARPTRRSPAPPRGRPAGLDLAREAALQALHPRGDRARARRLRPGRVGRRAGRRARGVRDVGRARARAARAVAPLAGGRPLRREPVAPGRELPPAVRRGADAAGPPARPAGRDARHGRRRPPRHRAHRRGRDRRGRGARQPDRRRARGPARRPPPRLGHGLARALGWEG